LGELALLPHRHLAVFEGPTSRGGRGGRRRRGIGKRKGNWEGERRGG